MDNYQEKFSQIYDQYIDKIYRFVYFKVSSQEISEDITSKVFLKGWEAFQSQGSGILNPSAFLYQIARNTVIDHYREKAKIKVISTSLAPQIVDSGMGLEEKAILSSEFQKVKLAIQNLKQDYQDIIICHYIDDMRVPEIAEIMGKPEGTVRVMLHRGLKALKKEIEAKKIQES
ncbi:MAG: RNA polymerase sigma factor [Candidatus Staskawiczbacteria bacterium]|nr:RNA polymerase sigma factor [Candidatus Staskawiczbacteria bacterium]MBI3337270.1 RNA polymerase sigma factor [Candidatus Staskawiczbacteria bacterium]